MLGSRWILPFALLLVSYGGPPAVRGDSAPAASAGRLAAKNSHARSKTDRAAFTDLLTFSAGSSGVATNSTRATGSPSVSELRSWRSEVRYSDRLIARQDAMLTKIWELGASTAARSRPGRVPAQNVREAKESPSQTARGKSTIHRGAVAGGRTDAAARQEARLQSVLSERMATLQDNQGADRALRRSNPRIEPGKCRHLEFDHANRDRGSGPERRSQSGRSFSTSSGVIHGSTTGNGLTVTDGVMIRAIDRGPGPTRWRCDSWSMPAPRMRPG